MAIEEAPRSENWTQSILAGATQTRGIVGQQPQSARMNIAMHAHTRESTRTFQRAREHSREHANIPESTRTFQRAREHSREHANIPESTRTFQRARCRGNFAWNQC